MKQHENIKYKILNIKNLIQRSKILKSSIIIVFFFILIINLISGQIISPLYFQFTSNDKQATVNFLEKIKALPEFNKILQTNKNIYGKTIEKEVFQQENDKKLLINNLEQQLIVNPKARDVLYSLYQLYLTEGDINQANNYLRRTKEVDPSIR